MNKLYLTKKEAKSLGKVLAKDGNRPPKKDLKKALKLIIRTSKEIRRSNDLLAEILDPKDVHWRSGDEIDHALTELEEAYNVYGDTRHVVELLIKKKI